MENLSVVIITYNEEKNIGRCIDSIRAIADEIIILDSYSEDKSVEIAEQKGAIVKQKKFEGFIEKKNSVLEIASNPYVLSLDADEIPDEVLINSILEAKKQFTHKAYSMNRCTSYCGRFIRHGIWYPDKKLRLFDKTVARWGGINPHDKVELSGSYPVKHLKGDILHFSYNSIEEHIAQNNKLSSMAASSLLQQGKRTSKMKFLVNPIWAFFLDYFLRLGLLDGFYGFVIAINIAHFTFLKHVKLYRLQQGTLQKQI
jgi:glycosyltransferase involved in cell wall biosynthesis